MFTRKIPPQEPWATPSPATRARPNASTTAATQNAVSPGLNWRLHLEKWPFGTRASRETMGEQPAMKPSLNIMGGLPSYQMIMRQSFFFGNHNGIGLEEREYIADSVINFLKVASNK